MGHRRGRGDIRKIDRKKKEEASSELIIGMNNEGITPPSIDPLLLSSIGRNGMEGIIWKDGVSCFQSFRPIMHILTS
jgi:hypothetical protein